jgi:hypothetical protein
MTEALLIEETELRRGYGMGNGLGVDVTDGDLVENFGDGIGIDLSTG